MAETIHYRFTVRGGSAAALEARNEIPLARELVAQTDTGLLKLGDGVTRYNDLPYLGGSSGAGWLRGNGEPGEVEGSEGDFYLDDLSGDVYAKSDSGWELVGNIAGGSGGGVQEVVAGANVSVDASDPARPVVSASGDPGPPGPRGPAGPEGPRGGGIISDTKALLHFDTPGNLAQEEAGVRSWVARGNVAFDPSVSRFGAGSAHFTGDATIYTLGGAAPDISAQGDFTAEAWVRRAGATRNSVFAHRGSQGTASDGWYFSVMANGSLQLVLGVGSFLVFSSPQSGLVPVGEWVHLAVVRDGMTMRAFVNGVQRITGAITGTLEDSTSAPFVLGGEASTGTLPDRWFLGHMDEFRFSNVARYTDDFTPHNTPFSFPVAPQLPHFSVSALPDALANRYVMVYVTDLAGGAEPCISDGAAWRRLSDRSVAN